jgi:hypothetical protein
MSLFTDIINKVEITGKLNNSTSYFKLYSSIAIVIIYILIFVYCWIYISLDNKEATQALSVFLLSSTVLLSLIIIVALSIIIFASNNYINSINVTRYGEHNWIAFIKTFILYIPCLFIDFVKYIISEFKLTTSPILILFIIELCFILGYIYLQELVILNESNPIYILENSKFLNSESKVTLPDDIYTSSNNIHDIDTIKPTIFRQNYAISMWIYLNNSTNNLDIDKNIFSFSDNLTQIKYIPDKAHTNNETSTVEQVLRISINNNDNDNNNHKYYDLIIPFQKWIYLVFNYDSSHINLFINGKLERTFNLDTIQANPSNNFATIGDNNGLSGAISNIQYFTHNLSKYQITNSYNLN